ncbi:unnamed protein product, partial [Mesorhabditis spiculigera]
MNALVQGMLVNGFISISIQSLERRFSLSSKQSSIFAGSYDVAVGLTLLPLSWLANKVNKVRTMGWGMMMVGFGTLLLVIPQFTSGIYRPGSKTGETCGALADPKAVCPPEESQDFAFPLLLIGQLLIGFGASPLFTYGYSTIDEFDSTTRTGVNMAYYLGVCTLGPAMAFPIGSQLLKIWGDVGRTKSTDFGIDDSSDPRWYGAWWIAFAVLGVLSFFTAIPLTFFPKKLNDTDRRKANDKLQPHADLNVDLSGDKWELLRMFKLFTLNPTCMCIIAMQTMESLLMNGYITYIPKLLENLFGLTSGGSSMATGLIIVPMGVIGNYLGGKIGERVKNKVPGLLKWCLIFMLLNVLCSASLLLSCPKKEIAGLNTPYKSGERLWTEANEGFNKAEGTCNGPSGENCQCSRMMFNPVCHEKSQITYLSPCHAGCHQEAKLGFNGTKKLFWSGCSCSAQHEKAATLDVVTKGWCDSDCNLTMYTFFALFALMALFTFASGPLIQSAALKVVSFSHRDAFICYGWMWMRFCGSVPGVYLFGATIDKTCLYWKASCSDLGRDSEGSCAVYDVEKLRMYLFALTIIVKVGCALAVAVGRYCFKAEPDEQKEKKPLELSSNHRVAPEYS